MNFATTFLSSPLGWIVIFVILVIATVFAWGHKVREREAANSNTVVATPPAPQPEAEYDLRPEYKKEPEKPCQQQEAEIERLREEKLRLEKLLASQENEKLRAQRDASLALAGASTPPGIAWKDRGPDPDAVVDFDRSELRKNDTPGIGVSPIIVNQIQEPSPASSEQHLTRRQKDFRRLTLDDRWGKYRKAHKQSSNELFQELKRPDADWGEVREEWETFVDWYKTQSGHDQVDEDRLFNDLSDMAKRFSAKASEKRGPDRAFAEGDMGRMLSAFRREHKETQEAIWNEASRPNPEAAKVQEEINSFRTFATARGATLDDDQVLWAKVVEHVSTTNTKASEKRAQQRAEETEAAVAAANERHATSEVTAETALTALEDFGANDPNRSSRLRSVLRDDEKYRGLLENLAATDDRPLDAAGAGDFTSFLNTSWRKTAPNAGLTSAEVLPLVRAANEQLDEQETRPTQKGEATTEEAAPETPE